jgi:hypothetical protein
VYPGCVQSHMRIYTCVHNTYILVIMACPAGMYCGLYVCKWGARHLKWGPKCSAKLAPNADPKPLFPAPSPRRKACPKSVFSVLGVGPNWFSNIEWWDRIGFQILGWWDRIGFQMLRVGDRNFRGWGPKYLGVGTEIFRGGDRIGTEIFQ